MLLERAAALTEAAAHIRQTVNLQVIEAIVALVPDDFLQEEGVDLSPADKRAAYVTFLQSRLDKLDLLVKEAEDAR